jgi:hypothetical protein
LERIWQGATAVRGGWVVDLDISAFFDSLSHNIGSEVQRFHPESDLFFHNIGDKTVNRILANNSYEMR